MHIFKLIYIFIGLLLWQSCANVQVALYDSGKRQEFANETREAYSKSEAGKEAALRSSLISTAQEYLGTKYKYGSTDPKQGFDCSGLIYHVGKENNVELPRSSSTLAASAPHIPWKKAKPGDLVFFGLQNHIEHVALIEKVTPDELWVIHSTIQRGVMTENVLLSSYWKKRVLFAIDFNILQKGLKS